MSETGGSKEVQKWADKAMFAAEPLKASDGPRVFLVWMTPDPLGAVAAMAKMYKGEVVRSLADVTDAERKEYLEQILKTKLQAPLESVKLHFMVENVTRSFTHQMVRQRTAVYAQESLRFAVKEDMAESVALPPSLQGIERFRPEDMPTVMHGATEDQRRLLIWDEAVEFAGNAYNKLIAMGMPAEDARGLLPHNITTRLNYVTDLRALLDHAGNRLCTQAQFEWRLVLAKMAEAIRNYRPHEAITESTVGETTRRDRDFMFEMDSDGSWQFEAISQLFKPVCYATGKCEFMAEFDRACSIRDRVQANHEIGRPSSEWGQEHDRVQGNPVVAGVGPQSVVRDGDRPVFIGAIQPAEWLLDPGAAR
jgi:flavin-dependent thymidylate synthase